MNVFVIVLQDTVKTNFNKINTNRLIKTWVFFEIYNVKIQQIE